MWPQWYLKIHSYKYNHNTPIRMCQNNAFRTLGKVSLSASTHQLNTQLTEYIILFIFIAVCSLFVWFLFHLGLSHSRLFFAFISNSFLLLFISSLSFIISKSESTMINGIWVVCKLCMFDNTTLKKNHQEKKICGLVTTHQMNAKQIKIKQETLRRCWHDPIALCKRKKNCTLANTINVYRVLFLSRTNKYKNISPFLELSLFLSQSLTLSLFFLSLTQLMQFIFILSAAIRDSQKIDSRKRHEEITLFAEEVKNQQKEKCSRNEECILYIYFHFKTLIFCSEKPILI